MKPIHTRSKLKQVRAKDLKPPSRADMRRLRAAMNRKADTSEMPEATASEINAAAQRRGKATKHRNVA